MKAQIATIDLGFTQFDGLMLPNGDYAIAVPQVADLFGIDRNVGCNRLNRLTDNRLSYIKISTPFNQAPINALAMPQFFELLVAFYNSKPNKKILDLCVGVGEMIGKDTDSLQILHKHNKRKDGRKNIRKDEKELQLAYQARYGGQIEVKTPLGNIDLVTDDSLYEFKYYRNFKEALGQVLAYSRYVKKAKNYIVLFGCPENFKYNPLHNSIQEICEDYGIRVRFLS